MENQTNEALETKPQKKLPWGSVGILLSAFAMIILIYAFYYVYSRLSAINMTLAQAVSHLQNDLSANKQTITTLQQNSQQLQDDFKKQSEILTHLQSQDPTNKDKLVILEAQQLVNQANNILRFENNITGAIALLTLADSKLLNATDPKVADLRRTLAADIAKLQAVPAVDVIGIYSRLSTLNTQIDTLPLMNKPVQPDASAINSANANQSWWKQGMQQMGVALREIVVVRYHPTGSVPLVTPEQQQFLLINLHAKLEQAMWALVHREQTLYTNNLQQASEWIKKYFVQTAPETQAALTNLNQLQQINIAPTVPDINASVQIFHDYFATSPPLPT